MIRNKKFVNTLFIILITLLLSTFIAFSALQTTLNITVNKTTQNALTWNIGFITGTIEGTATGTNTSLMSCGSGTATATTISGIKVKLANKGDYCSYTFKIQNTGNIAGKISSISVTKPSGVTCSVTDSTMVCGNITYKLHYDTATSTTLVKANDTIAAKSGSTATTKTIVLTAEYTGTNLSEEDFSQSGFAYTINYTQN